MKVKGYVRVSTEDQAKEGVSLEAQQARIKAYSIAKGWDLVSIEADPV
jgi:site-specific DNA recombinase